MDERTKAKLRSWLQPNTTADQIRYDIATIEAVRELETDDLNQLVDLGTVIADELEAAQKKKPGRPKGSKTQTRKTEAGGAEV